VQSLVSSNDGGRAGYAARKGKRVVVVVEGKEGAEYDAATPPLFSPDGKRIAYVARKGGKCFVVVDGIEGKGYFQIFPSTLKFSPDGRHVAYCARPSSPLTNPRGHWTLVVDGQEGSKHHLVIGPYFSPDGSRVAYAAIEGTSTAFGKTWGGKMSVNVDGQKGPKYDEVGLGGLGPRVSNVEKCSPAFGPDGKRMAYLARKGTKWSVIADGKEGPEYDDADDLVFSPDGKSLAYTAIKLRGEKKIAVVVVDDKEGPEYDFVGRPVFTPDGRHLAHSARKGSKYMMIVDGQEGPECDAAIMPIFSPMASAWHISRGKMRNGL
jgi:Tol biopolymer transport system component